MRRLILLAGVLAALPAGAATFVVAAGVERYDDPRIAVLQYAAADARAVAAVFRATGCTSQTVTVLTSQPQGAERQASRSNLLAALEAVVEHAGPDDKLIFFFAGHGVEEAGEQYLLTTDARRSLITETALPLRLVAKALGGLQAAGTVFLIDACRNDPQAGRADADAALTDGLARGLRPALAAGPPGAPRGLVATLLACDVGQRAWEDPETGHGVFTTYLLRGLQGAAAQAGTVTLSSLTQYVQDQIGAWAARAKRPQRPRLLNPDGRDLVLLVPPAEPLVSLSFANRPLAEVIQELATQYNAQVVLGPGADGRLLVSGRLENQPLGSALKALLAALGLQVRREAGLYHIEAATAIRPAPPPPTGPPAARPASALVVAADGSGQFTTITAALGKARLGATILIRPGTYDEQLVLTKPVTLQADGPPGEVHLTSRGGWTILVQQVRQEQEVVIRGFRLTARVASTDDNGGALAARSPGLVKLEDCTVSVTGPRQRTFGVSGGRAELHRTEFVDCVGTAVSLSGELLAEDCLFDTIDGSLAAVYVTRASSRFVRCRWTGEIANPDGVALRHEGGTTILEDCIFDTWCALQVMVGPGTLEATRCQITQSKADAFLVSGGGRLSFVEGSIASVPSHAFWCIPDGGSLDLRNSRINGAAVAVTVEDGSSAEVQDCTFTACGQVYCHEPLGRLTERNNVVVAAPAVQRP
ncbi:MAG: caspase family protein [Fimbriimonadaceae bacterium]|nr:caspase family protein [Fimbriimonadaceae bacterium]